MDTFGALYLDDRHDIDHYLKVMNEPGAAIYRPSPYHLGAPQPTEIVNAAQWLVKVRSRRCGLVQCCTFAVAR